LGHRVQSIYMYTYKKSAERSQDFIKKSASFTNETNQVTAADIKCSSKASHNNKRIIVFCNNLQHTEGDITDVKLLRRTRLEIIWSTLFTKPKIVLE